MVGVRMGISGIGGLECGESRDAESLLWWVHEWWV